MSNGILPIVTARFRLRRLTEQDLPIFARYRGDPDVARYQSWSTYGMADAVRFHESQQAVELGTLGTWYQIGIAERDSDTLVGDCALHFVDADQVEIGFTLAREHQGRGIMREAVSALLDSVFGSLGKHRAIALTDARNTRAAKLLDSLGFRREAHFVESTFFKGAWGDELLYACLAREWKEKRG